MPNLAVDFNREVYCVLGLPFDAITAADTVHRLQSAKDRRQACFLSTPNLNFLIGCRTNDSFRTSVLNSDLSICDGMPIVWLAHLLNISIPERVSGSGVFEALRTGSSQMAVFFFGGPSGVAEMACAKLNSEATNKTSALSCAGFISPGFGSLDDMSAAPVIDQINDSEADFLVVALGAKKGQLWIERNRSRITVPIISHLGAVVNFVAGTVNRAPRWMQISGLEWLWRIIEEPSLWRRYFADGRAFIRLFVTCILPYAWHLRRNPVATGDMVKASVSVLEEQGHTVIRLEGAWTKDNLLQVREAFQRTVKHNTNITLDMTHTTHVDSAFIALVMLLYGHQKMVGCGFFVIGLRAGVRQVFKYSCADFILGNASD